MSAEWEFRENDTTRGPFAEGAMILAIEQGLPATTQVRPVGREKWKPIGAHPPFAEALARVATRSAVAVMQPQAYPVGAPQWQQPVSSVSRARVLTRSEFIGKGCVVQGVGLVAVIVGGALGGILGAAFGLLVFLPCLVIGGRMSHTHHCGACNNALASRDVRVCPVCRTQLG